MKNLKKLVFGLLAMLVMVTSVKAMEFGQADCGADEYTAVVVGGYCYYTLEDAVKSVESTEKTVINVVDQADLLNPITIDGDKDIELNLRNDLVISKYEGGYSFYVTGNAKLSITGTGKIQNTAEKYFVGTDKTTTIYVGGNANLTIGKDVTVEGYDVINFFGSTNARLDLYGKLVSHKDTTTLLGDRNLPALGAGVYVGGGKSTVNIYDGAVIDGEGMGLYLSGANTTTIDKATIKGATGIAIKSGELNLNGTTVVGTYDYLEAIPSTTGIDTTGAAIQVESHASTEYDGHVKIHINGGTYTSEKGHALQEYIAKDVTSTCVEEISITGNAKLKSATDKEVIIGSEKFNETNKNFVAEGTTLEGKTEGMESYLAEGTVISKNGVVKKTGETENEVVVEKTEGDKEVTLSKETNDVLKESLSKTEDKELQAFLENNEDVTVHLEAKTVAKEDVAKEVVEKFEKVIKGATVTEFFDLDILVTAKDVDEVHYLRELSKPITLTIDLPKLPDVANGYGRKYYIIREHDGVYEKLNATLVNGKLSFATDKFSKYALAYVDEKIENPSTLDSIVSFVTLAITSLGIAGYSIKKYIRK